MIGGLWLSVVVSRNLHGVGRTTTYAHSSHAWSISIIRCGRHSRQISSLDSVGSWVKRWNCSLLVIVVIYWRWWVVSVTRGRIKPKFRAQISRARFARVYNITIRNAYWGHYRRKGSVEDGQGGTRSWIRVGALTYSVDPFHSSAQVRLVAFSNSTTWPAILLPTILPCLFFGFGTAQVLRSYVLLLLSLSHTLSITSKPSPGFLTTSLSHHGFALWWHSLSHTGPYLRHQRPP